MLCPRLAADLSGGALSPRGLGGVGCVLALMLYRWIVIQLGSIGLPGLGWSEKLILSWIAPRGIVTAAVASLFALQLEAAGVAGASALKGLVFLMILLTVGLQGFTAPSLAKRLGLVEVLGPTSSVSSQGPIPSLDHAQDPSHGIPSDQDGLVGNDQESIKAVQPTPDSKLETDGSQN